MTHRSRHTRHLPPFPVPLSQICAYFLPRSDVALRDADVLVLPYNYLVDPAVRE